MNKFKQYCKTSRFFNTLHKADVCQPIIAGGYGILEVLREHRLNPIRLKTKDIDIHLNVRGSRNEHDAKSISWITDEFIKGFVQYAKYDIKDVKRRSITVDLYNPINKILNLRIYKMHLIQIGDIQFDFVITDEPTDTLDVRYFAQTGLPIKTRKGYKQETFGILVRELIQGMNKRAYSRRNPILGENRNKGVQNMKRLSRLCGDSVQGECKAKNIEKIYKKVKDAKVLSNTMKKYYFSLK